MKKFFLHNGQEQQGPYDIEDLKAKQITATTPIWYEGLKEWTTAGNVNELKPLFPVFPPPFSSGIVSPPPVQEEAKYTDTYYHPVQTTNKKGGYSLVIVGLLITCAVIFFIAKQNNSYGENNYKASIETYQEKIMTVEEIERSQPTNFLKAGGTYNQNFWGNKLKVHGKIENKATVATYKDAVVKVTYYSKTKTELGSKEYTIYEILRPNSTVNFELKVENYKDVDSIGCDIVSATNN